MPSMVQEKEMGLVSIYSVSALNFKAASELNIEKMYSRQRRYLLCVSVGTKVMSTAVLGILGSST